MHPLGRPTIQRNTRATRRYHLAKRTLDLALTIPAVLILSPLLLVIAGAVFLHLGSPILFRQLRPGQYGQPFMLYKFRTMRDMRDTAGRPLPDGERLTPFGRFLRSTSLDELPELLNILKGEMSLVGPRPLLMAYLAHYSPEQARRHEVPPGLTGWAQIHGRNAVAWEERFALDVWYVDHCSLQLDVRILLRTVGNVLRREGIHQHGQATMSVFLGGDQTKDRDE